MNTPRERQIERTLALLDPSWQWTPEKARSHAEKYVADRGFPIGCKVRFNPPETATGIYFVKSASVDPDGDVAITVESEHDSEQFTLYDWQDALEGLHRV